MPLPQRIGLASVALVPILCALPAQGQVRDTVAGLVADIPVNYTEALVGSFQLPDPLVMMNGTPVRDAEMWMNLRRPELIRLFEENQFGRSPGRPSQMIFNVVEQSGQAFDGLARRRQVTLYFNNDRTGPTLDVLLYLPARGSGPFPVFLNVGFGANSVVVNDPGVRRGEIWSSQERRRVPVPANARRLGSLNVQPFLEAGIAVATVYYADLDPDFIGGAELGIRGIYARGEDSTSYGWGSIAAWSWGLRRVMDYFETDIDIDARRVALFGTSRVGKTVLWTAARDPRFAAVIASASGEGGAALSRRNYGETIAHLAAPTRYEYQFAPAYGSWGNRVNDFPVDAHMLLALIAPRPVLLQTGTTDRWSDPIGEFQAAVAAEPVYRLLGGRGLGTTEFPEVGTPIMSDISYLIHEGGHGSIPSDWPIFLEFVKKHLLPEG